MTLNRADKLFINGVILTQDHRSDLATQLAIRGKHILDVGTDLTSLKGSHTEIIDLNGRVVTPGFIDAHVHFLWGGETLLSIPVAKADSRAAFIQIVKQFAEGRSSGSWLKGGGWNEHHFTDNSFPHRSWLDEAAPGHPMLLTRHDGHSGVASSAALAQAGITAATPDPPGGVIDRDEQGDPTGILRDGAMDLVFSKTPEVSEQELLQNLEASQTYLLDRGITSVGDMIYDIHHFHFLQKMAREGKLKVRVTAYAPILKWPEIKDLVNTGIYEDEYFQFKGLKAFCDGSLGSHTALMFQPYADDPQSVGIYDNDWQDIELVKTYMGEADRMGYQTLVHAIGDRAVHEVLNTFAEVIHLNGSRDRRFRVEHAQHIHPQDQGRFGSLGVIASMQPSHCVDDALYAEKLLGDRCEYAYPFKALQAAKAVIAYGSDWPVSPADPIQTIHSGIHRGGWYMEQAMGLDEAILAHTFLAAHAGFREHDLGMLRAGYLADLVVLDPDFQHLDSVDELPQNLVKAVYMDGEKK